MQQQHPKKHEQPIRTDQDGAPIIVKVASHLVTIDRMVRFRAAALADQAETPSVLFYYAREKSALQASAACLRYHRAVMQRLPEPLGLLRQLVESWDNEGNEDLPGAPEPMGVLIELARTMLGAYPSIEDMIPPEGAFPEEASK